MEKEKILDEDSYIGQPFFVPSGCLSLKEPLNKSTVKRFLTLGNL